MNIQYIHCILKILHLDYAIIAKKKKKNHPSAVQLYKSVQVNLLNTLTCSCPALTLGTAA